MDRRGFGSLKSGKKSEVIAATSCSFSHFILDTLMTNFVKEISFWEIESIFLF